MLKVVCIDAGEGKYGYQFKTPCSSNLKEGCIYTVIDIVIHPLYMDCGYILSEVKSEGYQGGFLASRFVPLSTIDETELLKERESNLINI